MRPDTFFPDLRRVTARTTPAFRPQTRPAGRGFVHQLLRALARDTPAWKPSSTPLGHVPARSAGAAAPPAPTAPRPKEPLLSQARFLTIAETADRMRISKMGVYRLVHAGHLPAIRVGRSLRIPEDAVLDYLRGQLRNVS